MLVGECLHAGSRSLCQISDSNRAWIVIGMAIRSAYSLGLHIRNEDKMMPTAKREARIQIWWGICSLERILSIVTGRPSAITNIHCSVPLPLSYTSSLTSDEAEMSYLRTSMQLSIITQDIVAYLYPESTVCATRHPPIVQDDVARLSLRLDHWATALPFRLCIGSPLKIAECDGCRKRLILAFQLCSARMLLARPYLEARSQANGRESNSLPNGIIGACIECAKTTLDALPNEPSPRFIYNQGPWWCIVHYMMQITAVFLLCIMQKSATRHDRLVFARYTLKLLCWLRSMQDNLAERAYAVAFSSFQAVAIRYGIETPRFCEYI